MTNHLKKIGLILAGLVALMATVPAAHALNKDQAEIAYLDEVQNARRVQASSNTALGFAQHALNLFYVGTATEAIVTIDKTGITFYAPYNVADVSMHASDGQLTFANYATIGALCDQINTNSSYRCSPRDARRSDASGILAAQTGAGTRPDLTLNQPGGFDVALTSGSNAAIGRPGYSFPAPGSTPAEGKRVILKSCKSYVNSSGSANPIITVSGVKRKFENASDGVTRNDGTLVWSEVISSNTATTTVFDDTGLTGMQFGQGLAGINGPATGLTQTGSGNQGRVVVRAASDTNTNLQTIGAYTVNYLECFWSER